MNSDKTVASSFRPSHRVIAAGILFVLGLAVGVFRPAVSPMSSPPDSTLHSWRGEVGQSFTGHSDPVRVSDAEITLTGSDELTLTTRPGEPDDYQIKGLRQGISSTAFFHLLHDEKTVCLMNDPGQAVKALADVWVTLALLRRVPVTGSECTGNLNDLSLRGQVSAQERKG
ncbi:hypothetical protein [Erwinia amylovora]|uniref:hypothetical protein n=2 Tax=Erwinia amylovora TaxID=552 RepID=UPI000C079666|nr:hypothetical protein [Erwinia amylovora]UDJ88593.1 hypothetical protein IRM68_18000 [Erwinia amylovora]